ncbi:MAG: UDP-N-acetylmuramoyl-L-alanine--D-glutamate ligase, partial [Bacteroidia bacterium]|nr:UDP-N-acetylmuramoyl-L-alanine--D-glutamate ligase [Bacteroidia bacterium]
MSEAGRHIVILGAAESGVGAAVLAKKYGWKVFVSDQAKIKAPFKQRLQDESIAFEEERHTTGQIMKADLIVKSPGISE